MPRTTLDKKLQAKLEAQKKIADEITALKKEQAKQEKAERQRLERKLGRLVMQFDLHLLPEDELISGLKEWQKSRVETSATERHPNGKFKSDE
jgi:hypothetical protein